MSREDAAASSTSSRALISRQSPPVPILMYHQVSPDQPASFSDWIVSPDTFGRQMRWLARSGYTAISLDTPDASPRLMPRSA